MPCPASLMLRALLRQRLRPPRRGRRPGWPPARTPRWWCRPGRPAAGRRCAAPPSRSDVTTSTAEPLSASSVMMRWISSLAPTSTPWVGSASTSTLGTFDQLPGQHDLLGVTAGHGADRLALVRGLDGQSGDQVLGHRLLPPPVDEQAESGQQLQMPGRNVEGNGLEGEHPFELAVRRQQGDAQLLRGPAAIVAKWVCRSSRICRRWWPGPCRRCRPRSRRHRSRQARTGRRSRLA